MRERVERMRELDAAAADVRMIRRERRPRASALTGVPAFDTTWPSTRTWPARISARARSRDAREAALDHQRLETDASFISSCVAATQRAIARQVAAEVRPRVERRERALDALRPPWRATPRGRNSAG